MKKILAMAAVVALTASATSFAMDSKVKFSGDLNVKYERYKDIKMDDSGEMPFNPEMITVNPYRVRLRLQTDYDVNKKISISGRVGISDIFNSNSKYENKKVVLDRLHVMYKPIDGVMIDLGRTGVELGNDGEIFDNSFDGLVASYTKDNYAVQAGYGKVRLNEDKNLYYNIEDFDNVAYLKGSFDVNDRVNVGGYFLRSLGYQKVNAYGLNAKALIVENVSVFGDVFVVDVPGSSTISITGIQYGNVTDKVGSWHAKLKYTSSDKFAEFENMRIYYGSDRTFWNAEVKASIFKNATFKINYKFNQKASGDTLDNLLGLEFNYSF